MPEYDRYLSCRADQVYIQKSFIKSMQASDAEAFFCICSQKKLKKVLLKQPLCTSFVPGVYHPILYYFRRQTNHERKGYLNCSLLTEKKTWN